VESEVLCVTSVDKRIVILSDSRLFLLQWQEMDLGIAIKIDKKSVFFLFIEY